MQGVWERGIRHYGKEYLPSEITGNTRRYEMSARTNTDAGVNCISFSNSQHSFTQISRQREAHSSSALTSRGGSSAFHILPCALLQSHPYLEVRGRESQMMTQRFLLQWESLPTSVFFFCPCLSCRHHCWHDILEC